MNMICWYIIIMKVHEVQNWATRVLFPIGINTERQFGVEIMVKG